VNRLVNNRWVIEITIVSGIRSAVYYSTPKHTGHVLFPVLGAFVDAIGENRCCWYLYRLASLPPHGLVTICSSLLGTRRRNRALRHCLSVSTCFSAATRTGNDLFESLRHSSSQSSTPSLVTICSSLLGTRRRNRALRHCLSVSTCFSAATRTGNDLFESLRHSSSQSSTPSLVTICSSLLGTRRRNRALRHCLSTCFSAATRTGNDLFDSFRHSSSQSCNKNLFLGSLSVSPFRRRRVIEHPVTLYLYRLAGMGDKNEFFQRRQTPER
jgi:hypothetical protein